MLLVVEEAEEVDGSGGKKIDEEGKVGLFI